MRISEKVIYPELSYQLTGVLFAIHNDLGRFCNEKQYCDAIEIYLKKNRINYEREYILPPSFESELKGRNKLDFVVEGKIVLEVKAKRIVEKSDYYQTVRYLKATNKKLGIIVNFRDRFIKPRRVLNSSSNS